MGKNVKQWKSGGEEDKLIKKLIKQGKVNRFTKPTYLKTEHASVFKEFSDGVIRNHLNEVKRKCGLFLGETSDTEDDNGLTYPDDLSLEDERQLDQATNGSNAYFIPSTCFDKILHQNYPIVCKTYTDPDTETEKVLMVVSMPGGSQNVKVELGDDGLSATIKYSWAKSMYDVTDLFKTQFAKNEFGLHHALVSCYKSGLAQSRKRIDLAPIGSMKVLFPIKVQRVPGTWKQWGIVRDDGTQVLIGIFSGLAEEYVITGTDEAVKFGK